MIKSKQPVVFAASAFPARLLYAPHRCKRHTRFLSKPPFDLIFFM